jgi:hypothetical protein
MMNVRNHGRQPLEFELVRRAGEPRRHDVVAPGEAKDLHIDPTDPLVVARVNFGLIEITPSAAPAAEAAKPERFVKSTATKQAAAAANTKDKANG